MDLVYLITDNTGAEVFKSCVTDINNFIKIMPPALYLHLISLTYEINIKITNKHSIVNCLTNHKKKS